MGAEADRLGLDVDVVSAPYGSTRRPTLARTVLTGAHRPSAAFCFSDSIAYGVYAAARELQLRIPQDLSVIGYDDHPVSILLAPPLTSFSWDTERLVEVAVGWCWPPSMGTRAGAGAW